MKRPEGREGNSEDQAGKKRASFLQGVGKKKETERKGKEKREGAEDLKLVTVKPQALSLGRKEEPLILQSALSNFFKTRAVTFRNRDRSGKRCMRPGRLGF